MAGKHEFPLTPHGAFAIACAGIASFEGIARGELIATIIGATLSIILVFSLGSVLAAYLQWNRVPAALEKGALGSYRLYFQETGHRKRRSPFVSISCEIVLSAFGIPGDAHESILLPLPAALQWISPAFPPRGSYRSRYSRYLIADSLDFFRVRTKKLACAEMLSINVPPVPAIIDFKGVSPSTKGIREGKSTFLRSEELYEVRQYKPGDDPRRINWKVYAHTGEPALREGELSPPPSSEYAIQFWIPDSPAKAKRHTAKGNDRDEQILFEELVSRAAAVCLDLLSEGKNLRFPHADNRVVHSDDGQRRTSALEALSRPSFYAALSPNNRSALMPSTQTILFVLSPQNAGLRHESPIGANSPEDRFSAVYVGPVSRVSAKARSPISFARLIFEPSEQQAAAQGYDQVEAERYAKKLSQDGFNAVTI